MPRTASRVGPHGTSRKDTTPRYSDADLEPLLKAMAAIRDGNLRPGPDIAADGAVADAVAILAEIRSNGSHIVGGLARVRREIGREGHLRERLAPGTLKGSWAAAVEDANAIIDKLTDLTSGMARVVEAVAAGDLNQRVELRVRGRPMRGELLRMGRSVNNMVEQLDQFTWEVTQVAREVGTEGRLGGQAPLRGMSGRWREVTSAVNAMAGRLTAQVRDIAVVTTAVAEGDLTRKVTVEAAGELQELNDTMNTMVDQLSAFADEVTRVAREVGTEGRLGGQAQVRGVSGVWKDLTDNVNGMANNLTYQVRNIAQVTTAVAHGDLTKKIDVDARGEILELKTTMNTMVDTLSSFSSEVTRVARDVGSEGRLGGQAEVEGVYGTWKRLTTSVNELATNLTTQVRAIAEVASAVARGDLTRSITVDARGEVAELKDNVNLMVANLRETTQTNEEQDWLKSNLARIGGLMQGHRDLMQVAALIMSELTPTVSAQYGAFYLAQDNDTGVELTLMAGYGVGRGAFGSTSFALGEGLVGQAGLECQTILIQDAPADYIRISSGLGEAAATNVIVMPILFEDQVLGAIELASFSRFTDVHLAFFNQFTETIGVTINAIGANSRTESLLAESQRLAQELQERSDELQRQQAELRRSNAELEDKAALLAKQNRAIEIQNFQIEQARRTLEDRADQLAMSSRYKSEFFANMSHELRTPLNSLLVLAKLLSENTQGNLTAKQVEFAKTIYASGTDLLQLINDILDLSKVEAGKMEVHAQRLPLGKLVDYVDATFQPMAVDKGLDFNVRLDPDLPASLYADEQRLQQVLRNLLSNAVKFTADGQVRLSVQRAGEIEFGAQELLDAADVIAFEVTDTGIGISEDKLQDIFEAFQQADGTTSRRYGGTGLGLSISRNIARLLGGEIHARSELGQGSTFTLFLPAQYQGPENQSRAIASDETGMGLETDRSTPVRDAAAAGNGLGGPLDEPPADYLDAVLSGRKVLIIDDDVRNVFALTSVLEGYGMDVLYADDGQAGIDILQSNTDTALVLMDVMMPGLDGYATTEAIRRMPQFTDLPIIAITAKAMKGDREKSLESGASGYVPKPVDVDHLLDVMRTWLQRATVN
jgi:signal transduction histidine kinase/HAMP domain-containing protein/ActR/RegA family two-component response regulator